MADSPVRSYCRGACHCRHLVDYGVAEHPQTWRYWSDQIHCRPSAGGTVGHSGSTGHGRGAARSTHHHAWSDQISASGLTNIGAAVQGIAVAVLGHRQESGCWCRAGDHVVVHRRWSGRHFPSPGEQQFDDRGRERARVVSNFRSAGRRTPRIAIGHRSRSGDGPGSADYGDGIGATQSSAADECCSRGGLPPRAPRIGAVRK